MFKKGTITLKSNRKLKQTFADSNDIFWNGLQVYVKRNVVSSQKS